MYIKVKLLTSRIQNLKKSLKWIDLKRTGLVSLCIPVKIIFEIVLSFKGCVIVKVQINIINLFLYQKKNHEIYVVIKFYL